jgi:transcriptional regulator with XRE-family HTH domain
MNDIEKKYLKEFGERLKYFRKKAGYTNYITLAAELGISRSRYGSYENGGNIKFSTLVKIISHLNVSIKEFFTEGFNKIN